jgi:hypothetical protein
MAIVTNADFSNPGPWAITERTVDVVFENTDTGTFFPMGKSSCTVQYTYDAAITDRANVRPALQGSELGQFKFPPLANIDSITDKDGNALSFATLDAYCESLSQVLNGSSGGSGSGGGATTVDNLYLDTPTVGTVTTLAAGATFVALGSAACRVVTILNNATGAVDLEVAFGAATSGIKLKAQAVGVIPVSANADSIKIRRFDQGAAPVTVTYFYNTPSA